MAVDGISLETSKPKDDLYAPGWVDRFTDWVAGLAIPSWAFYLLVWLALFCLETGVNWYSGVYPPGEFFAYHLVLTGLVVYGFAAAHYLDNVADHALKTFRPALKGDDEDFARLEYKLTTMPMRLSILASVVGLCLGALFAVTLGGARTASMIKLTASTATTVLNIVLVVIIWAAMGAYVFRTARQLYLVSRIYTTSAHIDLFRRAPLYAFSGLTARTALSFAIIPYAGIISRPEIVENTNIIWVAITFTLISLLIFVGPLLGVHRLMEAEKRRLLDENGQKMEIAVAETHRRLDAQDLSGMDNLKFALDNLFTEQTVISKISTWPWQGGTVSVLATALFLPVILWVIERVLERVLGF